MTRSLIKVLLLLITCGQMALADDDSRPNVIVILADDLGYGDLSSYGGWIETPHLDALAARGLRFTDFHSNGAVCSPTRASLMTGRYPDHAGIPRVVVAKTDDPAHQLGLANEELTMAEAFQQAGYATAIFGKWHLGYYPKFNPVRHGFETFRGYVSGNVDFFTHIDQAGNFDWWKNDQREDDAGYVTHLITKYAVEFLDQNYEQPFFLYLPHEAPHYPYQGPNDKPIRLRDSPVAVRNPKRDKLRDRAAYRQMVVEMDRSVGQILKHLDDKQLTRNTLVWFMSDNGASGYLGSNSDLRGNKGQVWEGGHRVPSFVAWPGRIQPGVTDNVAMTMDVLPTLAAIANLDLSTSKPLDGIDISATLRDVGTAIPERTLRWSHGTGHAVRRGDWKLVRNGKSSRPQLFRLEGATPNESVDVASKHPNIVAELSQHLLP